MLDTPRDTPKTWRTFGRAPDIETPAARSPLLFSRLHAKHWRRIKEMHLAEFRSKLRLMARDAARREIREMGSRPIDLKETHAL